MANRCPPQRSQHHQTKTKHRPFSAVHLFAVSFCLCSPLLAAPPNLISRRQRDEHHLGVRRLDDKKKGHDPRLIHQFAGLMQSLDFDLMAFQRVIYNTRAYQARPNVTPEVGSPYFFAGPLVRRMTAGQAWDSLVTLAEGEAVNEAQRDRRSLMWSYSVFKPGAITAIMAADHKKEKNADADKKAKRDKEPSRGIEFQPLIAKAESMSKQLLGELHEGGGRKQRDGRKHEGHEARARTSERQQPEEDSHFIRQFGQSERELLDAASAEGSVPQTLMLMNGKEHEMLAKPDSHLMQTVQRGRTESEKTDLMYLSFLARRPTAAERGIISREKIGPGDLTWLLMNTREFIFIQ